MRVCIPIGKDRSIDISYRLRKPTLGALYFHFLFALFLPKYFLILVSFICTRFRPTCSQAKNEDSYRKKSNEKHIKKENTNLYVREREKERIDCGACESSLSAHLETLPLRN